MELFHPPRHPGVNVREAALIRCDHSRIATTATESLTTDSLELHAELSQLRGLDLDRSAGSARWLRLGSRVDWSSRGNRRLAVMAREWPSVPRVLHPQNPPERDNCRTEAERQCEP